MPDFEKKSIIAHHAHTVRTNRYTKQIGFGAWIIRKNESLRLTTLALINSPSLLTASNWTCSALIVNSLYTYTTDVFEVFPQ
jgi:hypothetical protein